MESGFSEPKPKRIYVVEFNDAERGWVPSTEQHVTMFREEADKSMDTLQSHYSTGEWRVVEYSTSQ